MLQFIKNFICSVCNESSTPSTLPDKVADLINRIDQHCIDQSTSLSDTSFSIVHFEVSLMDQFKSNATIIAYFKSKITPGYMYIPRSVAFVVSQDGTWHFYIGVMRSNHTLVDDITTNMWVELLKITNNARSTNDKKNPV